MGNRLITFEGTSIDVGGQSLSNYVQFYSQVPTTMQSPATNGATIADWHTRIATTQASLHATDLNILLIGGPANNFGNAGTQTAELASYMSYIASMKAYGISSGKKLKIVASTMIPHAYTVVAAYRPTFAAAIKARVGIDIDAVVDYGIDSVLGPNSTSANTLYFNIDGIHPTVKGQANMARVMVPVLDTFLNNTVGVRRFRASTGGIAVADTTAPTVTTYSPTDNAIDVVNNVELVLTFSETVLYGASGAVTLKKTSDNSTAKVWDLATDVGSAAGQFQIVGGNTLHMYLPSNLLGGTEYYVVWTAGVVKDASNNPLAAQSSTTAWSFTTVAAPPWTPLLASTAAIFWIDASNASTITKTGTAPNEIVTAVSDLGLPTAHNMAASGTGPVYVANILNGKAGLRVGPTSGWMKSTDFFKAAPFMIVCVWRQGTTLGDAYGIVMGTSTTGDGSSLTPFNRFNSANYGVYAPPGFQDQGVAVTVNTAYKTIFVSDGTFSSSTLNASNITGLDFGIGRIIGGIMIGGDTGNRPDATIHELFVIPYTDHAAVGTNAPNDLININAYLLAKWGV